MDWPTLIETLKAIMQRDGVNSQDLAKILDVSSSSVRNYLALRSRASISTRERIEKYVADHNAADTKPAAEKSAPARKANQGKKTRKQPDTKGKIIDAPLAADAKPHKRVAKKQAEAETAKATPAKQTAKAENKPAKNTRKQTAKDTKPVAKQSVKKQANAETTKQGAKQQAAKKTAKAESAKQSAKAETQTAKSATAKKQDSKPAATDAKKQTPKPASKTQAKSQQPAAPKTDAKAEAQQTAAQPATKPAPETAEQKHEVAQRATGAVVASKQQTPAETLRIYVDESFGRIPEKPFTVGMVLASTALGVMPFKEFTDTLYPFGWAPGDEVKAAGKDLANVKNILNGSQNDDIRMFAFRTTTVPSLITVTDDDSTTVAIFPYVSAIINAIEKMQHAGLKATVFQIVIDRTNKLPAEAQRVMEKLLSVYFRLSGNKPASFHITDGDSRAQKGLQLADFVAHYAYVEDEDQIGKFAPVTGVVDDPIGNARRFAFYSGLRLLRLKDETAFAGTYNESQPATEMVAEPEADTVTPDKPMSRAFTYTVDLRNTIIEAQQMGLGGKQLEAVRSRLKGLSTTVSNWLQDSQSELVEGLANRTISDFRQRAVVITRVDKPFQTDSAIGEQQFRIFESQLDKVKELIQSYSSTAEA